MLIAKDLKYTYTGGITLEFPDLSCTKESPTLIIGPSGSGKTTLLHLLAGLRTATIGTIEIAGQNIRSLKRSELDKFRGRNIGIVFQDAHFVESLTVIDNLRLSLFLAGESSDDGRIMDLLSHMNVAGKAHELPKSLSRGEQQRVSIAMALVNKPDLILADEPTSALDDVNAMAVIDLLKKEARSEGATLVVVTHDKRLRDVFEKEVRL